MKWLKKSPRANLFMNNTIRLFTAAVFVLAFSASKAQTLGGGEIHGNFQADVQYYNSDSAINAPAVPEKLGTNSFANVIYTNNNFTAGLRFESYLNAMQGYDSRYNGTGVPYRFIRYKADNLDVTAGNFYEQFGAGLILRTYEEKNLGIDNSLEGFRVKYTPVEGITVKAVYGVQRSFWAKGSGIVRGADAEVELNSLCKKWTDAKTRWIMGTSVVSKFQKDQNPTYYMPQNVAAFSGRSSITRGKVSIYGEYAYKINDPSYVNNFIYRPGQALLLNANYSTKGLGITLGAKRIDNMDFRSDYNATLTNLSLNYLPTITKQHTYALSAIYPYATQNTGEMGYQGEIIYTFKKESAIGGKYGTTFAINYSQVTSIQHRNPPDTTVVGEAGTWGYSSEFTKFGGSKYFEDFNVEMNKKLSSIFKMNLSYYYLVYNKNVIQGTSGYGTIYSHVGVAELTWKLTATQTLRTEWQHLYTEQDQKSWAMGLAEYSITPHWYLAALDMYNYGNSVKAKQIHYYNFSFGYTKNATRITMGYGKQREGIFCVGGVCRAVPASNGITLSITSSF